MSKETIVLQQACALVSASGKYGSWAFSPVIDGTFLHSTPSEALSAGKLNGRNHLTSDAAEEGFSFVPQNISTEEDLHGWIKLVFPLFTADDAARLRSNHPTSNCSSGLKYATSSSSASTALDTSVIASGLQQIANLIYSESTFICPKYWLAEACTTRCDGGYKF